MDNTPLPREHLRAWCHGQRGRITELAAMTGIARSTVHRWLSGTSSPSALARAEIERVTGIPRASWSDA